jgi:hypothetical protein
LGRQSIDSNATSRQPSKRPSVNTTITNPGRIRTISPREVDPAAQPRTGTCSRRVFECLDLVLNPFDQPILLVGQLVFMLPLPICRAMHVIYKGSTFPSFIMLLYRPGVLLIELQLGFLPWS